MIWSNVILNRIMSVIVTHHKPWCLQPVFYWQSLLLVVIDSTKATLNHFFGLVCSLKTTPKRIDAFHLHRQRYLHNDHKFRDEQAQHLHLHCNANNAHTF